MRDAQPAHNQRTRAGMEPLLLASPPGGVSISCSMVPKKLAHKQVNQQHHTHSHGQNEPQALQELLVDRNLGLLARARLAAADVPAQHPLLPLGIPHKALHFGPNGDASRDDKDLVREQRAIPG